jgi:hypothetical protein
MSPLRPRKPIPFIIAITINILNLFFPGDFVSARSTVQGNAIMCPQFPARSGPLCDLLFRHLQAIYHGMR